MDTVEVDGVEYCYEVEAGEHEELESELNIETTDEPHVLVDEIPTAGREEVVVTNDLSWMPFYYIGTNSC